MTPMADLFQHIRNETMYYNESTRLELLMKENAENALDINDTLNAIENPSDALSVSVTTLFPPTTLRTTQGLSNFNRNFRFRRQASNETEDSPYDYYDEEYPGTVRTDSSLDTEGTTDEPTDDNEDGSEESDTEDENFLDEGEDTGGEEGDDGGDTYDEFQKPTQRPRFRTRLVRPRLNRPPILQRRPEIPYTNYDLSYGAEPDYEEEVSQLSVSWSNNEIWLKFLLNVNKVFFLDGWSTVF